MSCAGITVTKQLQGKVAEILKKAYPELIGWKNVAELEYTSGKLGKKDYGDLQMKNMIGASRANRLDPEVVAQRVSAELKEDVEARGIIDGSVAEKGGYVNLTLSKEWMVREVERMVDYEKYVEERARGEGEKPNVVIDYSSPNLSKELHAGHLRSTIIGDSIVRILEYMGHRVVRLNFVGDWGTQFGMTIKYMLTHKDERCESLQDMESIYVKAKKMFDEDKKFADEARKMVVRIQSREPMIHDIWKRMIDVSLDHCMELYRVLGVKLVKEDTYGESRFNEFLDDIIVDLQKKDLIVKDNDALVVLTPSLAKYFKSKPLAIVRKGDGGYTYMASDLSSLRFRIQELKGKKLVYVVDSRQMLHFSQVFDIGKRAGYIDESKGEEGVVVGFGMVLGQDYKPFKTRSGANVKLMQIVDEIIEAAVKLSGDKNNMRPPENRISDSEVEKIGREIAVAALKYADLNKNRTKDYVLNIPSILSFDGDTAPYIMYSYTRCVSIIRKANLGELDSVHSSSLLFSPDDPAFEINLHERALILSMLQTPDVIQNASSAYAPHFICSHMYKVANLFAKFYESSKIVSAPQPFYSFRISLVIITAKLIRLCLSLIGVKPLEFM